VTIDEIRSVGFVGAGTMGCANSLVAAVSGYDVVLHDARQEGLDLVELIQGEVGKFLVESGYCSDEDVTTARSRVSLDLDLAGAMADVDLVSESVFEDLDLKRKVFRQLEEVTRPGTILTTNTSALLPSAIENAVAGGEYFAALHSHLGSLLFDIVGGPRTSPTTVETLRRYVTSMGGVPLVLNKEYPGYVFNAMNGPLLRAALHLVVEGVATQEEVDRAWMADRGAPMGPFGMMDLFGLELIMHSWQRPSEDPDREALREKVLPLLKSLVDQGRLGLRSACGFYDYPEPVFEEAGFVDAEPVSQPASDALLSALLASALTLVVREVVSEADVDLAWTAATGLSEGPFQLFERTGHDAFRSMLDEQLAQGAVAGPMAAAATDYLDR
jgi:3-hydroxybutyryl-CoA dehydrogenase